MKNKLTNGTKTRFDDLPTITSDDYQPENQEETDLRILGYHHFYQMGVYDAQEHIETEMRRNNVTGWRVGHANKNDVVPDDLIVYRVGQVRVHAGDQNYILYIWKHKSTKSA